MRFFSIASLLCLVSTMAMSMDLSKFGGDTPAMNHKTVSTETTRQTVTSENKSAVSSKTSGSDSETVALDTNNDVPEADTASDASEPSDTASDASDTAQAEVVEPPMAPNTMPAPAGSTPADPSLLTPPAPTPTYIYKGEKDIPIPPLLVKDPRVDDSYVYDMFPRKSGQ